ncbi:MAG: undecaprenyl/decaprenyl-phosphate alpha-N-acetylglucosaminyl 1-phosphate transferase [Candidatus Omnitrophica bacterium]|nr:undecaprenyl/decaprenyl-phosphate alpha-N-acetylglucosaminyl 1-phosphate transferase [Candidatus Omnitrophota bacterium]
MNIAAVAFFSGVVLVSIFRRFSLRRAFLLNKGIPCIGGLSMSISFFLTAAFIFARAGKIDPSWMGLFILSVAVVVFGVVDDLKNLSIKIKFLFQILVAVLLVCLGVRTQIMYLNQVSNILVSIIWLLWVFNAFNLLDVMDGLASGVAIIVCIGFFVVSQFSAPLFAMLSVALAASILSFFIFNIPEAKVYMGNSGSYFLGFVFGVISLLISYASKDGVVALTAPLLILGFPILDTVFLVLMRLWRKKVPFQKSDDHICLRYLALGYSKKKALLLLLGLCLFFTFSGVVVSRVSMVKGLAILAVVFAVSLKVTWKAARVKVSG